jgi:hypothetical protein
MRVRWIILLIVLIALAPKQVTAFCQQVFDAAMTVFSQLTVSDRDG